MSISKKAIFGLSLFFACLTPAGSVWADEQILFEQYASLDQLMKQLQSVSGLKPQTSREAPNVVTVITSEEIANSSARDLIDVLRLVPGFEFGVDVEGVVGLGVRGLWAQEGRVLLLWDGQPMNEPAYGTLVFGNHYPISQIKQIEIIRGPGSAIYGGYAELAVINIQTKSGADLNGFSTEATYGQLSTAYGQRDLSFSLGKAIDDLDVRAHIFWGQGRRSDQDYTSFYGSSYNMADNSQLDPMMLNFAVNYKGLGVQVIRDDYRITERDFDGPALLQAIPENWETTGWDLHYQWHPLEQLAVTSRFNWQEQIPYQVKSAANTIAVMSEISPEPLDTSFEIDTRRTTESVLAAWDLAPHDNITGGVEAYQEQSLILADASEWNFWNAAAFVQGLFDLNWVNLTVGGRCEKHSQYGNSFVPRVGLTKILGDFHFKLLYSQAFRAPQIENIITNPEIKPEHSQITEAEAGVRLTEKMFFTANLFDIRITDTIVYFSDGGEDNYYNGGVTGTRGAELEFKYRDDWGWLALNYAYNRVGQNEVSRFAVPGHDDVLLGFPAHKATVNCKLKLPGNFSLNPSVIFMGRRFAFQSEGDDVHEFPSAWLGNLFLAYSPLAGLSLGVGVNDIANQNPPFLQPYNGGHASLPGLGREFLAKVSYDLKI